MEHDKMAGAYYYKGEPEYRNMKILFRYATMNYKVEKTIVIISDTTREIIHIPDNDDAEHSLLTEVVLPLFVSKPKSKHKLFDIQTEFADQELTNNKATHLGSPSQHIVSKTKLAESSLSRSCASPNPNTLWRN
ncbi:hypothetical protein AAHA92_15802 [Salvia divinorum]|uniref:Uncharacterized protein n=1 Tax=Salvia divinorum TaxID=28513 RepID=A0ABD1HGE2_SALDI